MCTHLILCWNSATCVTPLSYSVKDINGHTHTILMSRYNQGLLFFFLKEPTKVSLSGVFQDNMQNNYPLNLHDFNILFGLVPTLSTVLNTEMNAMKQKFNHEVIQTKQYTM